MLCSILLIQHTTYCSQQSIHHYVLYYSFISISILWACGTKVCRIMARFQITLYLVFTALQIVNPFRIDVYGDKNHYGHWNDVEIGGCVDLNLELFSPCMWHVCAIAAADQVSSVDTHGNCIRAYRQYCYRGMVGPRIEPGSGCHSNWSDPGCGFSDDIWSISTCEEPCRKPNILERRTGYAFDYKRTRNGDRITVVWTKMNRISVPFKISNSSRE